MAEHDPALVAKAAEALRPILAPQDWAETLRQGCARAVLDVVVPVIEAQAGARALREAADEMSAADEYQIHAEAYDWLRDRAERIATDAQDGRQETSRGAVASVGVGDLRGPENGAHETEGDG